MGGFAATCPSLVSTYSVTLAYNISHYVYLSLDVCTDVHLGRLICVPPYGRYTTYTYLGYHMSSPHIYTVYVQYSK
ncbi:hypothetical protein GGS21DRAFT_498802 [Xylaria nigripes]|nr:hypothetical protein GGS21DRAFT_498802 [Xylaria nigripes]